MWTLLLVILVNGGASPAKFETHVYDTQEKCIIEQNKRESATVYGYCEPTKKESDVHHHFSSR